MAAPFGRLRTLRHAAYGAASVVLIGAGAFLMATPAQAVTTSSWWHLTVGSRPAVLPANPGEEGEVILTAANLGDGVADGLASPIAIVDTLPPHLEAKSISAVAGGPASEARGPVSCKKSTLTCTFKGKYKKEGGEEVAETLPPYDQIEVRIKVKTLAGATSGEADEVSVSGGGAPPASISRPLRLGSSPAPFGVESYELANEEAGGATATQAGSHPFQQTTTFTLNQQAGGLDSHGDYEANPVALPKDVAFHWPAGLLGNPSPIPQCTLGQFLTRVPAGGQLIDACPAASAVGIAMVTIEEPGLVKLATLSVPIFNLEPGFGEPARFGFYIGASNTAITIDPGLRDGNGGDYGIDVSINNITQVAAALSTKAVVWGTPADPSHDQSRGWGCLYEAREIATGLPCQPAEEEHPPAFLTLPTACSGEALATSVDADSWLEPQSLVSALADPPMTTLDSCNKPAAIFQPAIKAAPTSDATTTGTGLAFDLNFPNNGLVDSGAAAAESVLKKAVVTLPEGFTTNPSVAEGLKACSEQEYKEATVQAGTGCTPESKVGEVEVESPLVEGKKVLGGLYVARQGENPNHNLLTIYLIARNEELGVLVRQALKVVPDPVTGQLTTEVDDIPQLPFSRFHLGFRQGQRSPLITPPTCGTYTVGADLYPYSAPTEPIHRESSFQITQGPEGQPCPSGTPPFHPLLEAGTTNNAAGTYSPFYTHITRKDSEQEITHFSIKLPPGLSGKLAGVAKCSDAQIAAAKAREHELGGQEEIEHPSCPANSEVGHTLVGTGVGNVLAYAPGKLYLAGPYKGSQISIVSITAAKVGPFDLGTVVIREGLKVNPETAQVSVDAAGSDPIPHIVDGIPVHLRDIRIYVNRPNFTINPTSCAKMSTAATVLGSGLDFASEADDQPVTVTSPFQAADCASLGFKPKLALKLKGKTRRGGLPKLTATVTYPKQGAYANIAKTIVTLPPSEFLEQGHIGSSCTRVQFNAGGGNGEQCPAKSILGKAKAITPLLDEPVEGLVYLRSNGGERKLPDLVAALHSEDINIDLVGFISSLHKKGSEVSQIRNTFAAVPDAPVSKFTLELFGGKKGLLVNSTNICKGTHKAISEFTGQNGKLYDTNPAVEAQCGKKHKGHGKKMVSKRVGTSHR